MSFEREEVLVLVQQYLASSIVRDRRLLVHIPLAGLHYNNESHEHSKPFFRNSGAHSTRFVRRFIILFFSKCNRHRERTRVLTKYVDAQNLVQPCAATVWGSAQELSVPAVI